MTASTRMEAPDPILELTDVTKCYDAPDGSEAEHVLQSINLGVPRGETLAITGPSGSGKSTLLNIIGALDRPTSGRVLLDGVDIGRLTDSPLASVRNQKIGFVFQQHHLLGQCTALENVLVPTLACHDRAHRNAAPQFAARLLERVGLADRLDYRPSQLSGGQRQRVAVVRALINRPTLLLADEPTGAIDRSAADRLIELLLELNQEEQVTLIVASHSTSVAERMGRVLHLQDGQLHETRHSL